jgi:mannosyltransferase OCH1-like enzyme
VSLEIPRIFHQIWLGSEPFPREYVRYQRSWTRHHPGWELRLWTEESLPADLERKESYELLRQPAERSDVLRLELLYRHGGVYTDVDFECVRSIEPLLDGVTVFCGYIEPGRVNNAILGSVPGHPLLERAIREIRPRTTYGVVDKAGTGPVFLARMVADFADVTIFDEGVFYPRTPAAAAQAYAVHHAGRSWKQPGDLIKDVFRAEQRLAVARDELAKMTRRYDLARAEIDALRRGAGGRALALRTRRFLVRRIPRERIRYALGTLRARALRRQT